MVSNLVPQRVVSLCRAMALGDLAAAREEHFTLLPLAEALLHLESNPVPVKAALRLMGRDTGAVRLPLAPPAAETVLRLEQLLAELPPGEGTEARRHEGTEGWRASARAQPVAG